MNLSKCLTVFCLFLVSYASGCSSIAMRSHKQAGVELFARWEGEGRKQKPICRLMIISFNQIPADRLREWGIMLETGLVMPLSNLDLHVLRQYGRWYCNASHDEDNPEWVMITVGDVRQEHYPLNVLINDMYRFTVAADGIEQLEAGAPPFFSSRKMPVLIHMRTGKQYQFPLQEDSVHVLFGDSGEIEDYRLSTPL